MGGASLSSLGEEEEEEVEGPLTVVEVKLVTCVWVEDTESGPVSAEPPGTPGHCSHYWERHRAHWVKKMSLNPIALILL